MNKSYWEDVFDHSRTSGISSDAYDVIIIGSGIVGLTAAIELKKEHSKLSVLILERGIIPQGASTRNAGFACFGSPSEILSDIKNTSETHAENLIKKRLEGLDALRNLLSDRDINFKTSTAYEIFDDPIHFQECFESLDNLNKLVRSSLGFDAFKVCEASNSIRGFQCISILGEGQLHPGKMVFELSRKAKSMGVELAYGHEVIQVTQHERLNKVQLKTDVLECSQLVFATNGFSRRFLDLDVVPARNQVLLTEPLKHFPEGNFHLKEGFIYFRNVGNRILIGGARHLDINGETTVDFGLNSMIQEELEDLLFSKILGQRVEIDYRWSGIMGVGRTKTPFIKKINEGQYCAVKLGGMGIAIGALVGKELVALISSDL